MSGLSLRPALLLDAAASGGLGALTLVFAGPLSGLLGLPAGLLTWAGLVLLPFATALVVASRRSPRWAGWAVVGVNVFWVADSLVLLLSGWAAPTAFGVAFVLAQAMAVAAFAGLQAAALRRPEALASAV